MEDIFAFSKDESIRNMMLSLSYDQQARVISFFVCQILLEELTNPGLEVVQMINSAKQSEHL